MARLKERIAKLARALPSPARRVVIVAANPDGSSPPRPADFGDDDVVITLVGVEPQHGRTA